MCWTCGWRIPMSPTPLLICIHGGGFSGGDKRGFREDELIEPMLDGGNLRGHHQLSTRPVPYTAEQKAMYKSIGGAPQLDGAYTIFGFFN